jgi:hypothetical protein
MAAVMIYPQAILTGDPNTIRWLCGQWSSTSCASAFGLIFIPESTTASDQTHSGDILSGRVGTPL